MQRSFAPGGAAQACAVCKYQRRKCASDCPLAPFFPAHQNKDFLNAHKLFGVSNITKIIRGLNHDQRSTAMKTIIFQANVRAHDPVGGCYRIICNLHHQIQLVQAELNLVRQKLAYCRANGVDNAHQLLDFKGSSIYNDAAPIQRRRHFSAQNYCEQRNGFDNIPSSSWQVYGSVLDRGDYSVKGEFKVPSSSQSMAERKDFADVGDDIRPLLGVFCEKAAVPFNSKELICSDKIVLKVQSSQREEKPDLKNAASLFNLTSGKDSRRNV